MIALLSNAQYLAWELERVRVRIEAVQRLRAAPGDSEPIAATLADQVDERLLMRRARSRAVDQGVDIPFEALVRAFELSPLDEDLAMICLAPHLSESLRSELSALQGKRMQPHLELGFVCELAQPMALTQTAVAQLEHEAALVRAGLIRCERPQGEGFVPEADPLGRVVFATDFAAAAVRGNRHAHVDRALSHCAELLELGGAGELILPPLSRRALQLFLSAFPHGQGQPGPWRILVHGPSGSGKTQLVRELARFFGIGMLSLRLDKLAGSEHAQRTLELAEANARLLGLGLHLLYPERFVRAQYPRVAWLESLLQRWPLLCVVEARELVELDFLQPLVQLSLPLDQPDAEARRAIWQQQLGLDVEGLGTIATQYELNGTQIATAVAWAQQQPGPLAATELAASARSQLRGKLSGHGKLRRTRLTLDDLVLPEKSMRLVRELLDACRQRARVMSEWGFARRLATGRGIVTLFGGEAGTGKTLCAEILANELDRNLHIVNIPQVVSKFVGETEKNLQAIFREARATASVLLFDEADAFFAKRVKVESSADSYQNLEVNVLLQEVERYDGVLILTTNLEANIDRAFQRRILFRIDFPEPDRAARARIWRLLLPPNVPIAGSIDFDALGEAYELTGGLIKNALARAAYACAAAGRALRHDDLAAAAQRQAAASGKLTRRDEA